MSQNIVEIQELDTEKIPPLTSRMNDPEYNGGSKIVVVGKPGCFAPGTEIMMFNGSIKKVEDVKIGDRLMGDDSTPRNVLELCHSTDMMYTIKPYKGEPYTVNEHHILSLKKANGEIVDVTVHEYLKKSKFEQKQLKWYRTSVEFPEVPESDAFDSPIDKIKYNCSRIRKQRLGWILDQYGYFDLKTRGYELINYDSETFVDDIVFIARSVGLYAHKKHYVRNGQNKFGCFILGDFTGITQTVDVPNTQESTKIRNRDVLKYGFTVNKVGHGEYYGFILDGNHRFLGSDFSVLHNTGKSTLIRWLMYCKKHIFPVGMAMSGSEDTNHAFAQFMPSTFVYNEYEEEKIKDFVKRQKLARQHLPNPWAVMILDDCTDDPRVFNKPLQNALYKKGRHWKMMYILSLQYAMDVKPNIRTNIDGIFILREPLESNREKLYRNFASIIPSYGIFCDLLDQLTEDRQALYIDNTAQSNNWQDCVFYWKAKITPPDWKFGCQEYWDFHYQRYNEDYKDPIGF